MFKSFAIAFSATAAIMGVAIATPAQAEGNVVTRSTEVVYTDLNLSSDAGRKTLARRISAAATQVCGGHGDLTLQSRMDFNRCRSGAIAAANVRVAALTNPVVLASR